MDFSINKCYQTDILEGMKQLDDNSINCIITSPPYWQLRDYGWTGQWGLEKTYQEYLEHLWQFMDEAYRVLRKDGTVWINLGDSYNSAGSGNRTWGDGVGANKHYTESAPKQKGVDFDMPNKCLMLIPHRFAIGCIDRGWILRNDIIWAKRNGMPESTRDRFSKKHEFIFFMVKSQKYYFDLDGVRDKLKDSSIKRYDYGWNGNTERDFAEGPQNHLNKFMGDPKKKEEAIKNGKNPGDVSDFWDITTQSSKKGHYATYNTELIDKPIIAGCPEFVCKKCGKPREKILKNKNKTDKNIKGNMASNGLTRTTAGLSLKTAEEKQADYEFIGYTDCGCNAGFEGGIILDPFAGTGTTLFRAIQLNRKAIGFEGKKEYCDISNKEITKLIARGKIDNLFPDETKSIRQEIPLLFEKENLD